MRLLMSTRNTLRQVLSRTEFSTLAAVIDFTKYLMFQERTIRSGPLDARQWRA